MNAIRTLARTTMRTKHDFQALVSSESEGEWTKRVGDDAEVGTGPGVQRVGAAVSWSRPGNGPPFDGATGTRETPHPGLLGRMDERQRLDELLRSARAGRGGAVVLRGEAGIGKSALLDDLAIRALDCRICRAVGVESEMELAYAGLQQLCVPMMDLLIDLPSPRRDALEKVFGLSTGRRPIDSSSGWRCSTSSPWRPRNSQ